MDFAGHIDDQVELGSFLRGGLQIEIHIVRVDADWTVGVARCLLVLVVLHLVEGLNVEMAPVGHLRLDGGVFLGNGGVESRDIGRRPRRSEKRRQPTLIPLQDSGYRHAAGGTKRRGFEAREHVWGRGGVLQCPTLKYGRD